MLINSYRTKLPIRTMCALLKVPASSYYYQQSRAEREKPVVDDIVGQIQAIRRTFRGYGYRRVTKELSRQGVRINHKRVLGLMRENNLLARQKRKYVAFKDKADPIIFPNLTRGMIPTKTNQLWVADITYIALRREFAYLAAILDACTRRVIGWSLKSTLSSKLTLSALRMAIVARKVPEGLIHHSDRGVQYACHDYVDLLENHGICISMSRIANPYDNAKAESFFSTLKREEVNLTRYEDMADARRRIGYFIEDLYNEKRLHSSLGYLPPVEFEQNIETVGVY